MILALTCDPVRLEGLRKRVLPTSGGVWLGVPEIILSCDCDGGALGMWYCRGVLCSGVDNFLDTKYFRICMDKIGEML